MTSEWVLELLRYSPAATRRSIRIRRVRTQNDVDDLVVGQEARVVFLNCNCHVCAQPPDLSFSQWGEILALACEPPVLEETRDEAITFVAAFQITVVLK